MSRAFVMAMAACPAIAWSSAESASAHASPRLVNTVSVPNGPASPISGADITERMPDASM